MSALGEASPAERHRIVAAGFAREAAATADWTAQTPVPEWNARDVVAHLVEWFPSFMAAGHVVLPAVTADDPVDAWAQQTASVQALLDGDEAGRDFTHPYVGTSLLRDAVDRFYTADVFMHTWDLAQANGRRPDLDRGFAAELLAGLSSMEEVLRSSGQYGPARQAPTDADPVVALAAFIGRNPEFAR
ncbi:maleylpyruvate isomerase family mycothiol-dependent enzyme [Gordonia sp. (in: high G+C Gram-positive bacteria)]|uniref:maleylpyruvate isomerase family mycothiol-dependent enzyme n=1 Tax=Gordonia sp. (in: high G+C Gram-positive bacteria) TaxID=84139 RepID=UPI003F947C52